MSYPIIVTIEKDSHSYFSKSWGPFTMVLKNEEAEKEFRKEHHLEDSVDLIGDHRFYLTRDYDGFDERELDYILRVKLAG